MAVFDLEESEYVGPAEDDSVFEAEVVNIAVVTAPFKDERTGEDVKQVEFKFLVDEPDSAWDGQNMYGKTSTKFNTHPDCRLRNWSQAILASELPAGFRLDTDQLVGNHCRIIVGIREWTDKKTGEPRSINFVKDVMPSRSAAPDGEDTF